MNWMRVCADRELGPGEQRRVEVDGAQVLVLNLDGALYAIEDLCSHDGGELGSGEREGFELICARHGAAFDIRTGAVTRPPAYSPIHPFPIERRDGQVWVRDDRWD
jgi:3-phenylpropionate/trans-cinnamate dioxygenase ferredoxin component